MNLYFITLSFLIISLFQAKAQTTPTSWQDWDSENINAITTESASHAFVTEAIFDGDHSIKVDYDQNGAITFPYRYAGENLYNSGYLLITILNPSATHADDIFTIEFLDGGEVKSTCLVNTRLKGWNRLEMFKVQGPGGNLDLINGDSISDYIPANPDQIRIKAPKDKTGSFYVGKVFLGNDNRRKTLDFYHDRVTTRLPQVSVPDAPASVTPQQLADIEMVEKHLDEVYHAAPYTKVSSLSSSVMDDMVNRASAYDIQRNGEFMSGNNIMIYQGQADFRSNEIKFTELMLDVATGYRNTLDLEQKDILKHAFYDLYDFIVFIGGFPDVWSAGKPAMPAVYLMRDELIATNRLTPTLLEEFRKRIGFNRVYLDYAYFPAFYEIGSTPRTSRPGEKGEDLDYLRIISIALVMHALLADTPEKQVRDLLSVRDYFSDHALAYSPGIIDGLKPDGVMNRHWGWLDLYAVSALEEIPSIIYSLSNTEFRIKEGGHKRFRDQVMSHDMRTIKNIIPNNLTKKGGWPLAYGGEGQNEPSMYGLMAMSGTPDGTSPIDTEMAQTFLRSMNDQRISPAADMPKLVTNIESALVDEGFEPNSEMLGHKTYSYGTAAIHKRDNWMASLKGHSKWQYSREAGDPWVTYIGYGMLHINYDDVWLRNGIAKMTTDFTQDGYDYRNYPGTTTVRFNDVQKMVNKEYKRYWSDQEFVGGLTQDDNGAFIIRIHGSSRNGLASHYSDKSWFFFDDVVVALGSNIRNTLSAENTVTTLFQDKINNSQQDFTYYNTTAAISGLGFEKDEILTQSAWMMDSRNVGYWVPKGSKVYLNRRAQVNRNWDNKAIAAGNYAIAWIDHGKAPTDASLYYINRINTTPEEMSDFDAAMDGDTPPFSVLRHDKKVHAMKANLLKTYSGVVMNSDEDVDVEDVKDVSRPCVFMVKETGTDQIKFSLSDPDLDFIGNDMAGPNDNWGYSQEHTVVVKLYSVWEAVGDPGDMVTVSADAASHTTTLTFKVKDGLTQDVELLNVGGINNFPTKLVSDEEDLKVTLGWRDNATVESGFIIERKTSDDPTFIVIDSVGADIVQFVDTDIEEGVTYTYRVKAYDAEAASPYSNESTAEIPLPPVITSSDNVEVMTKNIGYPNPTKDAFTIVLVPGHGIREIRVTDNVGKFIFSQNVSHEDEAVSLDLSGSPVGVYVATMISDNSVNTIRIIKE